jgi:hypothetical protein
MQYGRVVSEGEDLTSVGCVSYPHAFLFFYLHVLVRAFVFCRSGTDVKMLVYWSKVVQNKLTADHLLTFVTR